MVQTAAFYGQYLTNAKSGLALDDDSTFCQNIVSIARRIVDRALHDFVKNFVRNRLHFFLRTVHLFDGPRDLLLLHR